MPEHDRLDQVAEQLIQRVERLLNERTTNYASATTAIVGGLQQDLQGNTEALNQLSSQIAEHSALLRTVGEQLQRLHQRLDISDRVVFARPLSPAAD